MINWRVCRACHYRIVRELRYLQAPTAKFVSLTISEGSGFALPSEPTSTREKARNSELEEGSDDELEKLLPGALGLGQPGTGRYSRQRQERTPVESNPVVRKITLKDDLAQLRNRLADPKMSAFMAWSFFKRRFYTEQSYWDREATEEVQLQERKIMQRLFMAVLSEWCVNPSIEELPTPSVLIRIFQELKIMYPDLWHKSQVPLILHLLKSKRAADLADMSNASVMSELFRIWEALFCHFRSAQPEDVVSLKPKRWGVLPSSLHVQEVKLPRRFEERFFHYLPQFPRSRTRDSILSTNALSTFALLAQQSLPLNDIRGDIQENAPFMAFIAQLVFRSELRFDLKPIQTALGMTFHAIDAEDIFQMITTSMETATLLGAAPVSDRHALKLVDRSFPDTEIDKRAQVDEILIKGLGRAVEQKNVAGALRCWQHALKVDSRGGHVAKLYRHFLRAFMALRQAHLAVQVWNHMIAKGVKLDVAAWTAMMHGCQESRDTEALETLWQKMLASGIKPDVSAWTARIDGLVSCRKWDAALRAFDQMARAWLNAASQIPGRSKRTSVDLVSVSEAVKPTIATINALISGLAWGQRKDATLRILAWAETHGIKRDAATYNALILSAFRNNNTNKVDEYLQEMDRKGIQPDIATFTIVLDSLFRSPSIGNMSQDDLQGAISKFLTEMESRGLETNAYLYSTLIDRLLKHQNNMPAAQALLVHMHSRGISPEATIYTILVTHYFGQDPPDYPAIDALWHRIPQEQGVVDLIFYDRMIEGYARHGQIGKMMTFLTRMSKEGKQPGWRALSAVIEALAHAGDYDRVDQIVRDVHREDGIFQHGCRGTTGRNEFWALVDSTVLTQ